MKVTRTITETRAALAGLPRPLGLVPTMGALHRGHMTLVHAARASCVTTAASLFVNPTQFAPHEDFSAYPRDEERDLLLLAEAGVAVVFAPDAAEVYPPGFSTEIAVRGVADHFEGASRPQFFGGVALAVTKLLGVFQPDRAFFGQKDAQQLAVVRRLVLDLNLPVEIVAVPTMRESDGLAMSSRNAYLSAAERVVAPGLYRALCAGSAAARRPGGTVRAAVAAATETLLAPSDPTGGERDGDLPRFTVDYLAAVDADTFARTDELGPRTLLVAAARLGGTRLLDNIPLAPSAYPEADATA